MWFFFNFRVRTNWQPGKLNIFHFRLPWPILPKHVLCLTTLHYFSAIVNIAKSRLCFLSETRPYEELWTQCICYKIEIARINTLELLNPLALNSRTDYAKHSILSWYYWYNTYKKWGGCCYPNWPSLVGVQSLCYRIFVAFFVLS